MFPSPLIRVERLFHIYRPQNADPVVALRGIDLEIKQGELVALIGANGSGKSTLARHLNALLLPTEGDVWIGGLNTRERDNHRAIRSQVGMVFQVPADQIVATVVEEDVAFGPENLGVPRPELAERVREALERVGMWAWRHHPPHLLSPGQQQRVAIAGALALRPRCLVLDEASAMLDPAGRRDLWDIIGELHADGLTILYITHDMDEAARAQRVIVLHEGKVALDGAPEMVFGDVELLLSLGLGAPSAAEVAWRLRRRFPMLPILAATVEELAAELLGLSQWVRQ